MALFGRKRHYKDMEDAQLVVLAAYDKDAFGELYERYMPRIYNYIYYRTGNAHDAEDLTAKVFHRAIGHMKTYEEKGVPFQAWLYRIAHNLVANFHRDEGRRKIIPLDDYVAQSLRSEAPEKLLEDSEEKAALLRAIRRLPQERQDLLVMKFVDNLSNAEIGSILGRTEGAIKSLYHRTLLALREEMRPAAPKRLVEER
ncbi:MAG: sigma-70 family RNA polymerase sigma factor [Anaerolineae bacterium]|nr:sigma-70 family RNA polymerase sigma factor [Anaerolineae bacterium]MDW8171332.1 sigma-70 family RNA polymerase sigma factor [Anaerolineae bacterium]